MNAEKEKPGLQAGSLADSSLVTSGKPRRGENFKPELWPANVSRLHAAGITFEWRRGSHDIVTACPACGSKLAMDAEKPFWLCLGSIRCEANRIPFAQVVAALTEKVEVAR